MHKTITGMLAAVSLFGVVSTVNAENATGHNNRLAIYDALSPRDVSKNLAAVFTKFKNEEQNSRVESLPYEQFISKIACNSSTSVGRNCLDEFLNAAKKMSGQEYEGDRARTAAEAVTNCRRCALETLSNQLHEFGSGMSSFGDNANSSSGKDE